MTKALLVVVLVAMMTAMTAWVVRWPTGDGDVAADAVGGVRLKVQQAMRWPVSPAMRQHRQSRVLSQRTAMVPFHVELRAGEISCCPFGWWAVGRWSATCIAAELVQEFKATTATPKVVACILTKIPTNAKPP